MNPPPVTPEQLSARLFLMVAGGTVAFFAAMALLFALMKV